MYVASHVVLLSTGTLPGYHAMRWSSVTLSAKIGKAVSQVCLVPVVKVPDFCTVMLLVAP